ncbi:hypothetical protein GGX14DRAFT_643923 [Mycena pura]|uniref:Uncharacterized protein n=1 Tax=Mycena pura TaxID=153505 RepID=A0AAD6UY65_9AGAR|nr:hypothetical protein GGX14DRAFT_667698 [Mycena pura]KAJ7206010.1 hypothetical protein GGX14DRAFT_643923 [Mycena pura]
MADGLEVQRLAVIEHPHSRPVLALTAPRPQLSSRTRRSYCTSPALAAPRLLVRARARTQPTPHAPARTRTQHHSSRCKYPATVSPARIILCCILDDQITAAHRCRAPMSIVPPPYPTFSLPAAISSTCTASHIPSAPPPRRTRRPPPQPSARPMPACESRLSLPSPEHKLVDPMSSLPFLILTALLAIAFALCSLTLTHPVALALAIAKPTHADYRLRVRGRRPRRHATRAPHLVAAAMLSTVDGSPATPDLERTTPLAQDALRCGHSGISGQPDMRDPKPTVLHPVPIPHPSPRDRPDSSGFDFKFKLNVLYFFHLLHPQLVPPSTPSTNYALLSNQQTHHYQHQHNLSGCGNARTTKTIQLINTPRCTCTATPVTVTATVSNDMYHDVRSARHNGGSPHLMYMSKPLPQAPIELEQASPLARAHVVIALVCRVQPGDTVLWLVRRGRNHVPDPGAARAAGRKGQEGQHAHRYNSLPTQTVTCCTNYQSLYLP